MTRVEPTKDEVRARVRARVRATRRAIPEADRRAAAIRDAAGALGLTGVVGARGALAVAELRLDGESGEMPPGAVPGAAE